MPGCTHFKLLELVHTNWASTTQQTAHRYTRLDFSICVSFAGSILWGGTIVCLHGKHNCRCKFFCFCYFPWIFQFICFILSSLNGKSLFSHLLTICNISLVCIFPHPPPFLCIVFHLYWQAVNMGFVCDCTNSCFSFLKQFVSNICASLLFLSMSVNVIW